MSKSYVFLPNFPVDIWDYAKEVFHKNINIQDFKLLKNEVNNIQGSNLIITTIYCDVLNYSQFKPEISMFISKPNIGMAAIHTDKSRYYSINIPILIEKNKSFFIAGKFLDISKYSSPKVFTIDNRIGTKFSFKEDDYEFVELSHPILINTKIPHAWTNDSENFRVVASLSFKDATTYSEAFEKCSEWM